MLNDEIHTNTVDTYLDEYQNVHKKMVSLAEDIRIRGAVAYDGAMLAEYVLTLRDLTKKSVDQLLAAYLALSTMKLISIGFINFLSYGNPPNCVSLTDRGLVLIEGDNKDDSSAASNGAGKSSLIDAIVWCLYGTTLRGYEGDEVINRKVGKNCMVNLVLENDVIITRYRKHQTGKNGLTVTVGDLNVTKSSIKETEAYIEQLLGLTKTTF